VHLRKERTTPAPPSFPTSIGLGAEVQVVAVAEELGGSTARTINKGHASQAVGWAGMR
jgi:hypothetical protein